MRANGGIMRFGLIGCGLFGKLRADALQKTNLAKLVAVCDQDNSKLSSILPGLEIVRENNWRNLIQRTDLDAVIISTPPGLHAELSIAALDAGKHVISEKPLARNALEGERILQASQRNGKFIATGYNFRFYPPVITAKELFDSGLIGELDHIRAYAGYSAGTQEYPWMHDVDVVGGGALKDNGTHLIDLVAYFLGDVVEISGSMTNGIWNFPGLEDNGFAILRNSAGNVAMLQASWTEWAGYRFAVDLYGKLGCIRLTCYPMRVEAIWSKTVGGPFQRKKYRFPKIFIMEHLRSYRWVVVQSLILEMDAFVNAANGQSTPIATGGDGVRALIIADSVTQPK
jgi:predicted dehydrogenase